MILCYMQFKLENHRSIWSIIWCCISWQKWLFMASIVGFFGWWVVEPYVMPKIIGNMIQCVTENNRATIVMDLFWLLAQYTAAWIGCNLCMIAGGKTYSIFLMHVVTKVKELMFKAIHYHSYDYFIKNNDGVLSKSLDILGTNLTMIFELICARFVPASVVCIIIIIHFAMANWLMMVLMIVWMMSHVVLTLFFFKKINKFGLKDTEIHTEINKFCIDNFKNQKTKEFCNLYKLSEDQFDNLQELDRINGSKSIFAEYELQFWQGVNCLLFLGVGFNILIFLLWQVGSIPFNELLAIWWMAGAVIGCTWRITNHIPKFLGHVAKCQSVLHLLDDAKHVFRKHHKLKILHPKGMINIKSLSFKFDNELIINKFSLKIPEGSRVLILGYSGIGKSTFIDIVSGLIQNYTGNVFYDNVNIKSLDRSFLRKHMSFITNYGLFNGSIAYNISFQENPEINRIKSILKTVGLDSLDYKFMIHSSSNCSLSDGEKQRILIARGLYNNQCKILVCDEPFKGLDFKNKQMILKELLKFTQDKTLIVVDHSLALSKYVDLIVFFGMDLKIYVGTFEYLSKHNKEFKSFINHDL